MVQWKKAYQLTLFELKHSKIYFLYLLLILVFLQIVVVPMIPEYFENSFFGLDFFFLMAFIFIHQMPRQGIFKSKKVSGFHYGSHHLIHLQQLPIKKEVIVRYQFLTYTMTSIIFSLVFIIVAYLLSPPLQDLLNINQFIAFTILWLSMTLYVGASHIVSDLGSNIVASMLIGFVLGIAIFFIILLLFYKIYPYGFVHWTIYISSQYPIFTTIISLLLAVIGSIFWMKQMKRKMDTYDFL